MSEDTARAAAAQRLIDDPLLIEALGAVKAAAVDAWEKSGARDTEARELAWITVKVVQRLEANLLSIVDNGKIAAARVQAPVR